MKRALWIISVMLLLLSGCKASQNSPAQLIPDKSIDIISVSSLPEGRSYSFSDQEDIRQITEYFNTLNLTAKFSENPDKYGGQTWCVNVSFSDGSGMTLYHFGNMFVRSGDGPWFKMSANEAERFDALLDELSR